MLLPSDKIIIVENHNQVLYSWRKQQFSKIPLVHIDAHSDLSSSFLKSGKVDIGNFIYLAFKEKIISDFYWIIPGGRNEFFNSFLILKKILTDLQVYDKNIVKNIIFSNNRLQTTIFAHHFIICSLEDLPVIKNPVLLDIDTDFFVISSVRNASNRAQIGKRKPWISINDFHAILEEKILNPKFITIADSVNGGWTPMIYKSYGDLLAHKFGLNNQKIKKNIRAGKAFFKFCRAFEKNELVQAKNFYFQAIKLNSSYKNQYKNYGFLHLLSGNLTEAYYEFTTMLIINKYDEPSIFGLVIIYLIKSQFRKAKKRLLQIIKINANKQKLEIYIYLAFTEYKLRNFSSAKRLLDICIKHNAYVALSYYLQALIKNRKSDKKNELYRCIVSDKNKLEAPYWLEKILFSLDYF